MVQGLIIGFSIAAPLGPVGILCIQRTLLRGRRNGLVSGLGAATADAVYGSTAGFGLTLISNAILAEQFWLRLLGGIFLCYLGARAVISEPKEKASRPVEGSLVKDFTSTFLLAITNPMAILYFAAIFSTLAGAAISNYTYSGLFVSGVFLGSLLWWIILSTSTGFFTSKFDAKKLRIANVVSGVTIIAFGAYFLLSLTNVI